MILEKVVFVDTRFFEWLRRQDPSLLAERMEWDVFLTTGWELKEDIRRSPSIGADDRGGLLVDSFPRFVWRATGLCGGKRVVDLVYDATDIETGDIDLATIWHDRTFAERARQLLGLA